VFIDTPRRWGLEAGGWVGRGHGLREEETKTKLSLKVTSPAMLPFPPRCCTHTHYPSADLSCIHGVCVYEREREKERECVCLSSCVGCLCILRCLWTCTLE
jgi:hypothetical protein